MMKVEIGLIDPRERLKGVNRDGWFLLTNFSVSLINQVLG